MLVQVAPGNAGSRDPENSIQNKPMIPRTPPATRAAFNHERLKTRPFLVAHQTPDQSGLPKSHLDDVDAPALTDSGYAAGLGEQEEERSR